MRLRQIHSICLRSDDLPRDRYLSTSTKLTEHDRPTFVDFRRVREALASVLANSTQNATVVVMFGSSSGGVAAFNIARWLLDTFGQVRFYGEEDHYRIKRAKGPEAKAYTGRGNGNTYLRLRQRTLFLSLSLSRWSGLEAFLFWVRECVRTVPS